MNPPAIRAARDDLLDTLDRILDKGIVIDQFVNISITGALPPERVQRILVESISIQEYGQDAVELEDFENLFPYWRRDLWSK
jgi:hypothetical protein